MDEQRWNEPVGSGATQAQDTALELFQMAALMLGNEEEAVSLVEETLADTQADPCADTAAVRGELRPRLLEAAVRRIASLYPAAFAVPVVAEGSGSCIESDDLASVGLSGETLASLTQGPGRVKMREWLEQLTPALRTIFVLRAIAGQDGERTAENLRHSGVDGAQSWRSDQVGTIYRQALCSLASSLVVANTLTVMA
jgi:DNA-directed RNA polymerase specialized sigma24 family protein